MKITKHRTKARSWLIKDIFNFSKINQKYTEQPKSIGICKNSVLKKKNLSVYKFKCAKKKAYLVGKTRSKKLLKTGNIPSGKRTRKNN